MVSPASLYCFAAIVLSLAVVVGRLRSCRRHDAIRDAVAALLGSCGALGSAVVLFAIAARVDIPTPWVDAGTWVLLSSPLAATLALRLRGRRTIPRALIASVLAIAGIVLWLTLNLRGPRGGWTLLDIAIVFPAAATAVAAAACLGWWSKATLSAALMIVLPTLLACGRNRSVAEPEGTLQLSILDASTGEPTPARLELLDTSGRSFIPDDALAVFSDCGNLPGHSWVPELATIQAVWTGSREVANPFSGTRQFYADGGIRTSLPAGRYSIRATKGIEYKRFRGTAVVEDGKTRTVNVDLQRWIDLPRQGWYGADDHLHIPRPNPLFDSLIATWMQAEGLNVANLLQMGLARDVHLAPQHGFGPRSAFISGDTMLLSGQENPRTHILGHAIVLGPKRFIDLPQQYLLYDKVWEEARRQGAVNGYAHWGLAGAEEGLAVWAPEGLLNFVEVLNLGFPFFDRWYEALDLGLRIGPTAGSDYPCLPGLPGRERFYTRLEGPLEAETWLEAVRQGKTFVTNGPVIELEVNDAQSGEDLFLPSPGVVTVSGRVRFDPDRDAITAVELLRSGEVVLRIETPTSAGEFAFQTNLEIEQTSWLALRALGVKVGETEIDFRSLFSTMLVLDRASNEKLLRGLPEGKAPRPSAAHTGVIRVVVDGTPPLSEQSRGQQVAALWMERLAEFESRLDDSRMAGWARYPGRGDGIDLITARANREALLEAIDAARRHYTSIGLGVTERPTP